MTYNKAWGKPTTDPRKKDNKKVSNAIANYLGRQRTPSTAITHQMDTTALEIQAQQKRLEDKVQKIQEELAMIHKKIDNLTKVIAHMQQHCIPMTEQASKQSTRQRLEIKDQQETPSDNNK